MTDTAENSAVAPLSIPVGFLIELSETRTQREVLEAFARWVRLILNCDRISVLLPGEGQTLDRILVEDNQIVQTGDQTPLYGTTEGAMFRSRKSIIIPDLSMIEAPDARHLASTGNVSAVMAPATFGDRCLGLLVAAYSEPKDSFDEDLLLLESMGRCLASYMLLHDQLFEMSQFALTDALTKVHNRRSFQQISSDAIERWEAQEESFSLLLCDLDRFKRLNDTYGHDFGDKVLCAVAEAMVSVARDGDYVVRMGGEEFCVLLTNTDHKTALERAELVRKSVSELTFQDEFENVKVTVSVGVAEMTRNFKTIRELTMAADEALYLAKEQGRNRVVQAA